MSQRTTKPTCATSKDSSQPALSGNLIRLFTDCMCLLQPHGYPKRDKPETLPCLVDVQADLSLRCSHRFYCRFCHALVHMFHGEIRKVSILVEKVSNLKLCSLYTVDSRYLNLAYLE